MQHIASTDLSLWLDSYDDIYSDFDSRNYLKRRISEDFIDELKASLKYRNEHIDNLVLLLPADKRNKKIENNISISLKEQLHAHYEILFEKERKTRIRGVLFVIVGILILAIDSVVLYLGNRAFSFVVARAILEPAGWFLIWSGLDLLMIILRNAKQETFFYKKAEALKIHFSDIEI